MKRTRLSIAVLVTAVVLAGCDTGIVTGANAPPPPPCNPDFPTMGSGC